MIDRLILILSAILLIAIPVNAQSEEPDQYAFQQNGQQGGNHQKISAAENSASTNTVTLPPLAPSKDLEQTTHNGTNNSKNSPNKWRDVFDNPVDVFTGIIAVFTIMLVGAGFYQVSITRAAIRRQLRAYVFVHSIDIFNVIAPPPDVASSAGTLSYQPNLGPIAYIVIKNSGQTPGYGAWHGANIYFAEFPLTSILPYSQGDPPDEPQWTQTIPPGGQTSKSIRIQQPLSKDQIAQLWARTHAIYVYGGIAYKDAFGKKRLTKYKYFINGMTGFTHTPSPMGSYETGNEAN